MPVQAECYEYLFEAAVRMRQLGMDASRPPAPLVLPHPTANGTANGTVASECSAAPRGLVGRGKLPLLKTLPR